MANRRTTNLNEGISMILPKQKNLQLREFHQFIQTLKFKNQENSFESIGALCGRSSRTPPEKKNCEKNRKLYFPEKNRKHFSEKKNRFFFPKKNQQNFPEKNWELIFEKDREIFFRKKYRNFSRE
jgi:hypothetical protein